MRGDIAPGGQMRMQIEQEQVLTDRDGLEGEIRVSNTVMPDAMSVYFVGVCLRDATEALNQVEAATERNSVLLEQYLRSNRRATRLYIAMAVVFGVLAAGNFALFLLRWALNG
jgi:hypothetical protein